MNIARCASFSSASASPARPPHASSAPTGFRRKSSTTVFPATAYIPAEPPTLPAQPASIPEVDAEDRYQADVGRAGLHRGVSTATSSGGLRGNETEIERVARLQKAALWVERAWKGRGLDDKATELDERSLVWYVVQRRLKPFLVVATVVYLTLVFFEIPSWCMRGLIATPSDLASCRIVESPTYPLLPWWLSVTLDMACLLVFSARFVMRVLTYGRKSITTFPRRIIGLSLLGLLLLVDCLQLGRVALYGSLPTISRMFRPVMVVFIFKTAQKEVVRVYRTLVTSLDVFLLCFAVFFLFTWAGVLIFARTREAEEGFESFSEAFFLLFVTFTTVNFPNVMMPIVNINRWAALYFVFFMVVTLFLLSNVLKAAFYYYYREELGDEVRAFYTSRDRSIEIAYDLLRTETPEGNGIDRETFVEFFLGYFSPVTSHPRLALKPRGICRSCIKRRRRSHSFRRSDSAPESQGERGAPTPSMALLTRLASASRLSVGGPLLRLAYPQRDSIEETLQSDVLEYQTGRAERIFELMDLSGSGLLELHEFLRLAVVMADPAVHLVKNPPVERMGILRRIQMQVGHLTASLVWGLVMDACVVVSAVVTLAQTLSFLNAKTLAQATEVWVPYGSYVPFWGIMQLVLLCAFAIDLLAAFFCVGFERVWNRTAQIPNRFDTLVFAAQAAILAFLAVFFPPGAAAAGGGGEGSHDAVSWSLEISTRTLAVVQMLRLGRVLWHIPRVEQLCVSLWFTTGAFLQVSSILCVCFYVYGVVGIQWFGGLIWPDTPVLQHTDWSDAQFWGCNFNNMPGALTALFSMLIVNNWNVLEDGLELVTAGKLCRLYTVSFNIICVILILNILVAAVVDAFVTLESIKNQKKKELETRTGSKDISEVIVGETDFLGEMPPEVNGRNGAALPVAGEVGVGRQPSSSLRRGNLGTILRRASADPTLDELHRRSAMLGREEILRNMFMSDLEMDIAHSVSEQVDEGGLPAVASSGPYHLLTDTGAPTQHPQGF
ncbi:unnamed protein product [Vitrella brassicaformis CCMP3155]|uniref:EF-hand domain-containing protein n=2 Tax=Vitrella brassicaformis TaxID=1169539 RepID=A0A0G4EP73_VITBC|nr:unnamed protein product [Vitrella brassicaformis CCMP3155]|eukprot:CEL98608.1 unnamed protein product [Vitrella brassicaformis CCMP3155]